MPELISLLSKVPPALWEEMARLLRLIAAAPDPATAIERAKFFAAADAAKLIADEALDKALANK